ncbi:MAG TPA: hypothetical protein VH744_06840, partial [Terriglobales bacterium]
MKKQVILHPLLLALFPASYLFGTFHQYLQLSMTVRPVIVCLSCVCAAWVATTMLMRDKKRAAIVVSLLTLAFFSYQAVSEAIGSFLSPGRAEMASGHMIIAGCFTLALAGGAACWKLRGYLNELTYVLNVIGTILVATPLVSFGIQQLLAGPVKTLSSGHASFEAVVGKPLHPDKTPDIYYIVLDGYGREDYLRDNYKFDNAET